MRRGHTHGNIRDSVQGVRCTGTQDTGLLSSVSLKHGARDSRSLQYILLEMFLQI